MVQAEADRRGAHHVRLVPLTDTVEILFDVGGPVEDVSFSPAGLSALALRLKRLKQKSGWHVETYPAGFGTAVHVLRVRAESRPSHPVDWTDLVRAVRESAAGLIVLVGPDAYAARHALAKVPAITDADAWKAQSGTGLFDADDPAGRELAIHAALRGLPAVAVCSGNDGSWWEAAAGAVPVRVWKGYRTREGHAWEAYSC